MKGVLLINLGTPDTPDPKSVYRYLTEFLNDTRVIDLPAPLRWILTNLIIIPFRYKKTAKAYQKIWTESGSPLLDNSNKLSQALAAQLGNEYKVALGMRYGKPNIKSALEKLKSCEEIIIIPLFPQYSSAATGSAIDKTLNLIAKQWNIPAISTIRDFYNHPGFITAYSDIIKINLKPDYHLLLSYHGLPERHITKSDCQAQCDHQDKCPAITANNSYCYRAQCYQTSELIAKQLSLTPEQYTVAFQSRLGRTPWIKPYTDLILPELRKKGIKNLAIVCPSFVADCLETLEEVNIRTRAQWMSLGGNEFIFIPCLNDSPIWIKQLAAAIKK